MNNIEQKDMLLKSIENNTKEHWKNYYKDVPIECIYDDLVIDINEIKRLTEENKELKEHIEKYEHYCKTTGIEELIQQNQKYKEVIEEYETRIKYALEELEEHQKMYSDEERLEQLEELNSIECAIETLRGNY